MGDSGASSKRTKVLDVEIQYTDLQDIPKDIENVDSDNNSIEAPIYAWKYWPKAYSAAEHLDWKFFVTIFYVINWIQD